MKIEEFENMDTKMLQDLSKAESRAGERIKEEDGGNSPPSRLLDRRPQVQASLHMIERTQIGPFKRINGIVGPNGGGKSTILECMYFAMGGDKLLDEKKMKYADLYSNFSEGRHSGGKSVEVSIWMKLLEPISFLRDQVQDSQGSNIEEEKKEEEKFRVFRRELNPRNKNSFYVDEKEVDQNTYLLGLEECRLSPLQIMKQDKILMFTNPSPQKLMELMEKICGSWKFAKDFRFYEKKIKNLNQEKTELNGRLRLIEKDKKKSKKLMESVARCGELIESELSLEGEVFMARMLVLKQEKKKIDKEIKQMGSEIDGKEEEIDTLTGKLLKNKEIIIQDEKQINPQILENRQETSKIENELFQFRETHSRADRNLQLKNSSLVAIEEDLNIKSNLYQDLKNKKQKIKTEIDNLSQMPQTQLMQTLPNPEDIFEAIGLIEKRKDTVKDGEKTVQNGRDRSVLAMMACRKKEKVISQKLDMSKKRVMEAQEKMDTIDREEKDLTQRVIGLKEEMEKEEERIAERDRIRAEEEEIKIKMKALEGVEQDESRVRAAERNISREAESFRGTLSRLVAVIDNKYRIACGLALGSKLLHLVVHKQKDVSPIDRILKSYFLSRDILVLENFTSRLSTEELWRTRGNLTDGGRIAYDLFQIKNKRERKLDLYLKQVLNGIYIMPDLDSALRLKRRLGRGFKKIITLQGEIIGNNSIQSYGNERNLPMYVRRLQEFSVVRERDVLERRLIELGEQREKLDDSEASETLIAVEAELDRKRVEGRQLLGELEILRGNLRLVEKEMELVENKIEFYEKKIREADTDLEKIKQETEKHDKEKNKAIRKYIKKERLRGKLTEKTVFQGYIAQQGVFQMQLKLKNQILEVEEKLDRLNLTFTKEQKEALIKSLKKEKTEFSKLEKKIKKLEKRLQESRGEAQKMDQRLKEKSKETDLIKKQTKTVETKILQLEEETLSLRKKRILAHGTIEKLKMKKKEILQDKNMKSGNESELDRGRLTADLVEEIREKVRSKLKMDEDQDVVLDQVKTYLRIKKQNLLRVKKELGDAAGNLNSEDFLKHEKEKVKSTSDLIKKERKELRRMLEREHQLKKRLKILARRRVRRLKAFLEPLKTSINSLYMSVTHSNRASCSLIVENETVPFQGGLVFTATPPGKKFTFGTEGLSSGELTLANMSFFLAVNYFMDSPFVIFDETDSHLDRMNLSRYVKLTEKLGQMGQMVFVTHREPVYARMETLIGVSKAPGKGSQIFALNQL